MRNIKTFALFESDDLSALVADYRKTFDEYCSKRERDNDVRDRAIALLDEMLAEAPDKLRMWLTGEGKTLALQSALKKTTYSGNGNSREQLRDFNAFTLLDTVAGYHRDGRDIEKL